MSPVPRFDPRRLCGWLCLAAWLLCVGTAAAASFHARLELDGDQVQLTYSLKDAQGRVGEPQFPPFEGLNLVSGPAVGTNLRIVNGASSQEKTWSFVFLPKGEGSVKVPPAKVVVNGTTLVSEAVTVPGRSAKQAAAAQPVRLSFEVEPRRPVVGQAVRLRLRLDFSANVRGYDQPRLGAAPGFMVEPLEIRERPEVGQRTVGGQTVNTAVLGEWLLFPVRKGPLHLAPVTLNIQVEQSAKSRRRDPFDFFGGSLFNQVKTVAVTTDPLEFQVEALPGGAPVEFQGAVGSFSLTAEPDKRSLKAGEALTLTVAVEGAGNFSGLEAPALRHSPDLERYDTQTSGALKPGARGQQGRRVFKTLFVPRVAGEQRIEPVVFAWYDPAARQYKRVSAGPWTIQVEPGDGSTAAAPGPQGPGGQLVRSYGTDIRQALEAPAVLERREEPAHHRWPWLAGFALALGWMPGMALWARRRESLAQRAPQLRGKAAHRRALARLRQASGPQAQEELLRGYLADRLRREPAGLLLEDCLKELARREAPAELRSSLEELWRRVEFQRYGGGAALDPVRLKEVLDHLEAWFNRPPAAPGRGSRLALLLPLLWLAGVAQAATPEQRFQQALDAYGQGDAAGAARQWQALVDEGHGGFELSYNLGNAWYRQGDLGRAVLHWERARQLRPSDRDVLANLALVRPALADRFEEPVRLPVWDLLDGWLAALSGTWLAWGGLLFGWLAAGVGGLRYVRPERSLTPALRLLVAMLLVPALLALGLLVLRDRRDLHAPQGVVLVHKVEVRAAPSAGATAQFDLHAGTKVRLLRESAEGWRELMVPDGRSGWVPAGTLEAIRLPAGPARTPQTGGPPARR